MTLLDSLVLAAAGGGSSGFGGGGGGGGGGGAGGTGSGGEMPAWMVVLIIGGFVLFFGYGMFLEARRRKRRRERVARTHAAAAEASEDDAWFAPAAVASGADQLFHTCQQAWDAGDRAALERLVGPDLMVEWRRRLDDFATKGWRNRVAVKEGPAVEYLGLTNRDEDHEDRVVVRLQAKLRDVVETGEGRVITKKGSDSEVVSIAEYWTLARRDGAWIVVSIEGDDEGEHHLDAPLVASPWADEQRLRDEAVFELAHAGAAPDGTDVGELVDLDFADDARAAALDLSLVDDRFAPHVLEAAARRAVAAWAEAVDGDDAALAAIADPGALNGLLYPTPDTRLVVRGPRLGQLRIVALDGHAQPPALTIEAELRGRRYVEDRDTLALLSGSRDDETTFTKRWRLELGGPTESPWRLASAAAAV